MSKLKKVIIILMMFIMGINIVNAKTLDCSTTLKLGSKNTSVTTLQSMLNDTMSCGLTVDGIFGSKTKTCVLAFQKKYGLTQDGIVGSKTCSKINSLSTSTSVESSNNVVITADTLNVRSDAGTTYSKVTTVKLGDVLSILGTKTVNGVVWYKIKTNGKTGYISGEYAKKNCILVDIASQKLTYYKNGKIVLDTSVVTGTLGKHDTPKGHYTLNVANKVKGKTLRGTNDDGSTYASYVNYWMPFITSRGIGFHDASWRSNFGGKIYQSSGSHGCINMPTEAAASLYSLTTSNTDVVVA
jgi:peptidoglycan hydrolase-like protein with peptidoglycan-binding domain